MVANYNGSPDTDQLSVQKGQHVEVLESHCPGKPTFSLIRLPQTGAESPVEGIVPAATLRITQTSNVKQANTSVVSPDDAAGRIENFRRERRFTLISHHIY